jgi:hypothetical protein
MKRTYFALLTLVLLTVLAVLAPSQSGGVFVMKKSSIASGGERSASGIFIVDGTIGQSFGSATSAGGIYTETGGFWSADPIASGSPSPTPSASISGTVTYGNASVPPKYISNVAVTGSGSPNVTTTTAPPGMFAGTYSLTGFGSGSYTVSLSKTTGQNSITSNDAGRIAQHVAGTNPLNTTQKVVADVTGNGAVSSNDAAKIAQYVAGLPFSPPNLTGTWQFYLPPGPTFPIGSSPTSRT